MNSDYLDKLKAWGLDWGMGDSRNPEECKNKKGGQHTNCVTTWLKYKNSWYVYRKCGLLKLLDSFTQCESQEDVDLIVQIMIDEHLLDNYY
jgi:hypothetical protein